MDENTIRFGVICTWEPVWTKYLLLAYILLWECSAAIANALPPDVSRDAVSRLERAYPENVIAFSSGAGFSVGDQAFEIHQQAKTGDYENASLLDQLALEYPSGPFDYASRSEAGRMRHEPFFRAIYGNSFKEVSSRLVRIPWRLYGSPQGQYVRVTKINGVDRKVRKMLKELKALPKEDQRLIARPFPGSVWRKIAGTERLSMHSFGIAIDFQGDSFEYWRWRPKQPRMKNSLPALMLEIFEAHCFIWGGKWEKYDSMHIEYRPELLPQCKNHH